MLLGYAALFGLASCLYPTELETATVSDYVGGEAELTNGGLFLVEPGPEWDRSTCPDFSDDVYGEVNGAAVWLGEGRIYPNTTFFPYCGKIYGTFRGTQSTELVSNYPEPDFVVLEDDRTTLRISAPGAVELSEWPLESHPDGRVPMDAAFESDLDLSFDPRLPPGYSELESPDRNSLYASSALRPTRLSRHDVEVVPHGDGRWRIVLPDSLPRDEGDLEVRVDVWFQGRAVELECGGFGSCLPPRAIEIPVTFTLLTR